MAKRRGGRRGRGGKKFGRVRGFPTWAKEAGFIAGSLLAGSLVAGLVPEVVAPSAVGALGVGLAMGMWRRPLMWGLVGGFQAAHSVGRTQTYAKLSSGVQQAIAGGPAKASGGAIGAGAVGSLGAAGLAGRVFGSQAGATVDEAVKAAIAAGG